MYCGKCGTKLDETTGLCPKCSGFHNPNKEKVWLIILSIVFISGLLITGFWVYKTQKDRASTGSVVTEPEEESIGKEAPGDEGMPKEDDSIKREQVVWTYPVEINQENFVRTLGVAVDGKPLDLKLQGYTKMCRDLSGKVWCAISGDGTLYALVGESVLKIAQGVTSCALSTDGETLAYVDSEQSLILFYVSTQERTIIAQNVDRDSCIIISPDGKTVAYVAPDGSAGASGSNWDALSMYVYSQGEITEMGKNQFPIGISNGGRQIFYVTTSTDSLYGPCKLYVGDIYGSNKLLAESQEVLNSLRFNVDQTQLLFNSDGNFYLCVNGEEAIQLTLGGDPLMSLTLVIPRSSASSYILNNFDSSIVYSIKDFSEHYYTVYPTYSLLYLNKDLSIIELGQGREMSSVQLSENENVLMYSPRTDKGYTLYRTKTAEKSEPELLAENIRYGVLSPDGDSVYYLDQNDTLWYRRGLDEPKQIAVDIEFCNMSHDGYALFGTFGSPYDENKRGILYCSKDGGEKQELLSNFLDCLYVYPTVTLAYANYNKESYTNDIYASVDGVDFVKIVEGAIYEEVY